MDFDDLFDVFTDLDDLLSHSEPDKRKQGNHSEIYGLLDEPNEVIEIVEDAELGVVSTLPNDTVYKEGTWFLYKLCSMDIIGWVTADAYADSLVYFTTTERVIKKQRDLCVGLDDLQPIAMTFNQEDIKELIKLAIELKDVEWAKELARKLKESDI